MAVRVAVSTGEDSVTPEHFGRARHFVIVDVSKESREVVEIRDNVPACGGAGQHDNDRLASAVERIADCRYVFAVNIGPGAEVELARRGLRCLPIVTTVDDALDKLARSPLVRA